MIRLWRVLWGAAIVTVWQVHSAHADSEQRRPKCDVSGPGIVEECPGSKSQPHSSGGFSFNSFTGWRSAPQSGVHEFYVCIDNYSERTVRVSWPLPYYYAWVPSGCALSQGRPFDPTTKETRPDFAATCIFYGNLLEHDGKAQLKPHKSDLSRIERESQKSCRDGLLEGATFAANSEKEQRSLTDSVLELFEWTVSTIFPSDSDREDSPLITLSIETKMRKLDDEQYSHEILYRLYPASDEARELFKGAYLGPTDDQPIIATAYKEFGWYDGANRLSITDNPKAFTIKLPLSESPRFESVQFVVTTLEGKPLASLPIPLWE